MPNDMKELMSTLGLKYWKERTVHSVYIRASCRLKRPTSVFSDLGCRDSCHGLCISGTALPAPSKCRYGYRV